MLGNRVQVVQVVKDEKIVRRRRVSRETERQRSEFLRYLNAPTLTEKGLANMFGLFAQLQQRLSTRQLQNLLNSQSVIGCMSLPPGCTFRSSCFLDCDSEDPKTFRPVKSDHEATGVSDTEAILIRNASGQGRRPR